MLKSSFAMFCDFPPENSLLKFLRQLGSLEVLPNHWVIPFPGTAHDLAETIRKVGAGKFALYELLGDCATNLR